MNDAIRGRKAPFFMKSGRPVYCNMNAIDLIGRHIDAAPIEKPLQTGLERQVCAFSGKPLERGYLLKDVVSGNWTDWDWFRYKSEYVCEEFVKCVADILPSCNPDSTRFGGLRNYSFHANAEQLKLLRLNEIMPALFAPPAAPFVFVITAGGKKHCSFKAPVNYDQAEFAVQTDAGAFAFSIDKCKPVVQAMSSMYSIVDPADKQGRTWFTKDEILTLNHPPRKIDAFGVDRWIECCNVLNQHQGTLMYKYLVTCLIKNFNEIQGWA